MANYTKLITAAIGLAVLVAKDFFGIQIGAGMVDQASEFLIAIVTLVFVERLPNT